MEKFIYYFKKFVRNLAGVSSGAVLGSLYISHSDGWKFWLPVCLLCLTLLEFLRDE